MATTTWNMMGGATSGRSRAMSTTATTASRRLSTSRATCGGDRWTSRRPRCPHRPTRRTALDPTARPRHRTRARRLDSGHTRPYRRGWPRLCARLRADRRSCAGLSQSSHRLCMYTCYPSVYLRRRATRCPRLVASIALISQSRARDRCCLACSAIARHCCLSTRRRAAESAPIRANSVLTASAAR